MPRSSWSRTSTRSSRPEAWGAAVFQSCSGPGPPEGIPDADAPIHRAECQHGIGSRSTPPHARPLHALLDDVADGALGGPAPNLVAGFSEGPIAHPLAVGGQVTLEVLDRLALDCTPLVRAQESQPRDHLIHPDIPEAI